METTSPTQAAGERARHDQSPPRKIRLTVNLPKELVDQMRDAVYWTPGLTLAWMIARAMRTSLAEMHSTNRGPFPKRTNPLRAGRPRLTGQTMTLRSLGEERGVEVEISRSGEVRSKTA